MSGAAGVHAMWAVSRRGFHAVLLCPRCKGGPPLPTPRGNLPGPADEIDAIGRARGRGGFAGGNDERENTLNQLLVGLQSGAPGSRAEGPGCSVTPNAAAACSPVNTPNRPVA